MKLFFVQLEQYNERPRDKSLNEQRTCCVSCSDMVLIERL